MTRHEELKRDLIEAFAHLARAASELQFTIRHHYRPLI